MLARAFSAALQGIDAYLLTVEADIAGGLPLFTIVGLPDTAIQESRERVRAAIRNSGYRFPFDKRVTINLAPADVRKGGPSLDLPIAIGILAAGGQIDTEGLDDWVFVGELALDGSVRPVSGVLPVVIAARNVGKWKVAVPSANGREAAVVEEMQVYPVETLLDVIGLLVEPETRRPLDGERLDDLLRRSAETLDFVEA